MNSLVIREISPEGYAKEMDSHLYCSVQCH